MWVASILMKGGEFFHSRPGITFPVFAVAGNTPRAERQGFEVALLGNADGLAASV